MKKVIMRNTLLTGKNKNVKFARLIGEIIALSHMINMTTEDHFVKYHMGLPNKQYGQFYCSIDTDEIGSPIFLKDDGAEKKLRNLKKRLENILLEANSNGKR